MNDASMHSEAHENNQLLVPLALTHVTRCYNRGTLSHRWTLYQTRDAFAIEGHFGSKEPETPEPNMRMATQLFAHTATNIHMANKQREE